VAGAEQVVSVLFVECHWATYVSADLGVGNNAVVAPASLLGSLIENARVHSHQKNGSLGFFLELVLVELSKSLWNDVEHRTHGHVGSLDWYAGWVLGKSGTRAPHGALEGVANHRAQVAKDNSSCPSGRQGGDLGSFGPGQMVKEFDTVVFSAPLNEVQGPVQTQFGYHLLEVTSRKD